MKKHINVSYLWLSNQQWWLKHQQWWYHRILWHYGHMNHTYWIVRWQKYADYLRCFEGYSWTKKTLMVIGIQWSNGRIMGHFSTLHYYITWYIITSHHFSWSIIHHYWLVVYLPLWKIWVRQMGVFFPTEWKVIKIMFQTTNQVTMLWFITMIWDGMGRCRNDRHCKMGRPQQIGHSLGISFLVDIQRNKLEISWG